jgi:hypothetical protein
LKLSAADIYTADGSGLNLVNRGCKIIAPKGSKPVFTRKSGEGSENVAIAAPRNDTGTVILPPMTIYKEDLRNGAPEDTIFAISPKIISILTSRTKGKLERWSCKK